MKKITKNVVGIIVFIGCLMCIDNQVSAETYEYDKLNRLKMVTYDTGQIITYEYDVNGNVQAITSSSNSEENSDLPNQNNNGTNNSADNPTNNEQSGSNIGNQNKEQLQNDTNNNQQNRITKKTVKNKKANYSIFFKGGKVSEVQLSLFKDKKAKTFVVPNTIKYKGKKYKVTAIGEKAFSKKKKLQKITIGKYIKTIGKNAFYHNKKLTTIIINSTRLTTIGKNALKGTNKKLKIKVKTKSFNKYRKLFKNKGNKYVKVIKK